MDTLYHNILCKYFITLCPNGSTRISKRIGPTSQSLLDSWGSLRENLCASLKNQKRLFGHLVRAQTFPAPNLLQAHFRPSDLPVQLRTQFICNLVGPILAWTDSAFHRHALHQQRIMRPRLERRLDARKSGMVEQLGSSLTPLTYSIRFKAAVRRVSVGKECSDRYRKAWDTIKSSQQY